MLKNSVGFQTCPADQGAIYLRLLHKLSDIVGSDTAAIENTHLLGNSLTLLLEILLADKTDGLICLLTSSCLASADSPDRLIGYNQVVEDSLFRLR